MRVFSYAFLALAGLTLAGLFQSSGAFAANQDPALVRQTAETFARQQTASLPGQVSVVVGTVEAMQLPACVKLQAFMPPGAKLWGNSSIGVRCASGSEWSVYVPVTVRVQGSVVTAARALNSGKALALEDVSMQTAELTQLPSGILSDPNDVVGKVLTVGVNAGYALRQDMLRGVIVVRQGQSVRLVANGPGFKVSSEGKAMSNAAVGQVVQVKAQNGQTVSGTVRPDGLVEVQY